MDKDQLREILSSDYNQLEWINFLKEVFHTGEVFRSPQTVSTLPGDISEQGYQLGKFETKDGYEIGVFEVHLKENVKLHRNRVGVRNLLNRYYSQLDGVFAVFKQGSTWRFSFISQLRDWDEEQEKWVKKETEPKRYTYLLGKGEAVKTATDRFYQLVKASSVSFEDIKEAFSVEKLNKEFYKKVVSYFYDLLGVKEPGRGGEQHPHLLELPSVSKESNEGKKTHQEFAVRLIGRMVFCWFLKFKTSEQGNPIIPEDALSSASVCEGYYHQKLERLFFQVLNTQKEDRRDDLPDEYKSIPFLNGGLFEPHAQDFFKPNDNTGLSEHLNTLKIPDEWFRDLFKVLEQYNFTIDENSVEDADVSVDPEMLGRIFENLLAEIDPASGDSARKATGSYYTPREIVDYMVDESLNKYLHKQTGIEERRLLPLFKFDADIDYSITDEEKTDLIHALNNIKVLDPACGSGAFPMGILQKMVRVLEKVDPESNRWKELQLEKIPSRIIRRMVRKRLDDATVEYARKLGIIQHSIYGIDIQPIAAEISKLRCFLSLVVDEQVDESKDNWNIEPLPNLEFKFLAADSLQSLPKEDSQTVDLFGSSDLLRKLGQIRDDYLQAYGEDKTILKEQFEEVQDAILEKELKGTGKNKSDRAIKLSSWEPFEDSATNWFDTQWMFGIQQFDVVLGNPPYGGNKISHDLKKVLGLGSRDPYGAFMARFLPEGTQQSPLANEGLLCFIVSDTFMTIKTHYPLREKLMDNYTHKMIRVHKDTFGATVNTAITLCERNEFPVDEKTKKPVHQFDDHHTCLMADLTQTSIHKEHERFLELLEKTVQYVHPLSSNGDEERAETEDSVLFMRNGDWTIESSEEYALYSYPQAMINRNKPFFVTSPKLFRLMADDEEVSTTQISLNEGEVTAREISMNGSKVEVVKLGQIADVKQGLATGDNDSYLFQNPEARGTYRDINEYHEYLLTEDDLETIQNDEELRLSVIEIGISKDDTNSDRYFGGRYIVPYDKGGASDASGGWMPNYWVPTDYFIDWSEWAVERLKTLTTKERNKQQGKKDGSNKLCSRFQNTEYYFLDGIDYSPTGYYSPTFRKNSQSVFCHKASSIFLNQKNNDLNISSLLPYIVSKPFKYILKTYSSHTVETPEGRLKQAPVLLESDCLNKLQSFKKKIFEEQRVNGVYDYTVNEQVRVDQLIYTALNLNKNDINEVENWYARRYPKLVEAQKENLKAQGKHTDYVELYEQLEEAEGA